MSVADLELGRVERRAAARPAHWRAGIPDFTLEVDVDVTALEAARGAVEAPRPSLNDAVIAAVGRTLPDHPRLRGRFRDDRIEIAEAIDVGFAVATDHGLMVPVARAADRLDLAAIAAQTRELAGRTRGGAIGVAEMIGGCFTVSNLGMLGVTRFQAVIDPEQAAILAVGALRTELARRQGLIVDRSLLSLSLSVDHRVADGVAAARFLGELRGRLEQPAELLAGPA